MVFLPIKFWISQKGVKNMEEKEEGKKKEQTADEIANSMASNMSANMKNPNFIEEHELLQDEVRRKIIQKRKEQEQ